MILLVRATKIDLRPNFLTECRLMLYLNKCKFIANSVALGGHRANASRVSATLLPKPKKSGKAEDSLEKSFSCIGGVRGKFAMIDETGVILFFYQNLYVLSASYQNSCAKISHFQLIS